MKLDQLDGYLAFVTVAQLRSFTAAAAQLDVSPQAISHAVKTLEDRLCLRLLNRTTRSVSLTEAGLQLFERAAPALSELFAAAQSLQVSQGVPSGRLRVNLSHVAFTALLRPRLAQFCQQYPQVQLELGFDDGLVDIVAAGFDLGIRLGEAVDLDMVSVALSREERIAIVATPAYLARHGRPETVADLAQHRCIRFRKPTSGAIYRWELADGERLVHVDVAEAVLVNDTDAMLALALEGVGLAYVLESAARAHLRCGQLMEVLTGMGPRFPGFHLYYPSRHMLPAKLRGFIEFWRAPLPGGAG